MEAGFVRLSALEIQIQGLRRRVDSFTSGSAYQKLKDELASANRTIAQLHEEIERLKKQNADTVKKWMEVNEDVEKEKERELAKKEAENEKLRAEIAKLKQEKQELKAEKQKALEEKYAVETELQDYKEKVVGLTARLNKDSTNSSYSSARNPNHPPTPNNREKSGLKPGGQVGHEHHPRTLLPPTHIQVLPTPPEFLDTTKYRPTGIVVTKQLVNAHVEVDVIQYEAAQFRNIETGQLVHAEFPLGLKDDLTYGSSVKALCYLLNNKCNVSIQNVRRFLSEASNGTLNVSDGFICQLTKKFAELSQKEQDEAFNVLANAEVFHVDFTFGRADGKTTTVAIVCDDAGHVVYTAKDKKGHEGVKGTPAEFNQGICISDHEAALIVLGSMHQDCLGHCGRYAKGSADNETKLTWNTAMKSTMYDIIRYRHGMAPGEDFDPEIVQQLEARYHKAIELGRIEYEEYPPSKYYREGYNLWKRMAENPEEYLLTLHNLAVMPTNNVAERYARKYKRKSKQVMTFRSLEYHSYYCRGLTALNQLLLEEGSLLEEVINVFDRSLEA